MPLVELYIPMGWSAPSGPAAVIRNSVEIIPSVAGEVVDVPVKANTPLKPLRNDRLRQLCCSLDRASAYSSTRTLLGIDKTALMWVTRSG